MFLQIFNSFLISGELLILLEFSYLTEYFEWYDYNISLLNVLSSNIHFKIDAKWFAKFYYILLFNFNIIINSTIYLTIRWRKKNINYKFQYTIYKTIYKVY